MTEDKDRTVNVLGTRLSTALPSIYQLVQLSLIVVTCLTTVVGIYFGFTSKFREIELAQMHRDERIESFAAELRNSVTDLTAQQNLLSARVDAQERTMIEQVARGASTAQSLADLKSELNSLNLYLRDQFTAIRSRTDG